VKVTDYTDPTQLEEIKIQMDVYNKTKRTPAIYDYWTCNDESELFIIMQRFDGTLRDFYGDDKYNEITKEFVRDFSNQAAVIIDKVHQLGYLHNDIHDNNFFYKQLPNKKYKWFLGDWGRSKRLSEANYDTESDNSGFSQIIKDLNFAIYMKSNTLHNDPSDEKE